MTEIMKNRILAISALFLAICSCGQNENIPVEAESIKLSRETLELKKGDTQRLTAEVLPEDAEDKTVRWTSLKESIASVDETGLVSAVAIGETVIKATCGNVSARCLVTVTAIPVTGVKVVPSETTITKGSTQQLSVEITPEDADNKEVTWSSSDESVVLVDANGMISAVAIGNAAVKAAVGGQEAECQVTVAGVGVENITLEPVSLDLMVGETAVINASVQPEDADYDGITWTSSNAVVASVDAGSVVALSQGEAVITATAGGKEASCTVTVSEVPVTDEINIGDIYFSDGTTSPVLVEGKTPVGVVFYVGDPSVNDAALRREHPDCMHGLVVALEDAGMEYWQLRIQFYQRRVGDWVTASGTGYKTTVVDDETINLIMGYNNTKAIEAFNEDEANWDWNVDAIQYVLDYRESVAAPETSSGWYWPSPKELSLLCTGEYNGSINDIFNETDNLEVINGKLSAIGGTPLNNTTPSGTYESYYWSSAESSAYQQAIYVLMSNGSVGPQSKGYPQRSIRCVLAF